MSARIPTTPGSAGAAAHPSWSRRCAEERKVVSVAVRRPRRLHRARRAARPGGRARAARPYHARLRARARALGGTVEKFIGDAVVAVFGAPVAHEDDAERAVRAALAIRDVRSRDGGPSCRCGSAVNTGEALVRSARGRARARGWSPGTSSTPPRASSPPRRWTASSSARRPTAPPSSDRVPRGRADRGEGQGRAGSGLGGVEARSRFGVDVAAGTARRSSAASGSSVCSARCARRARASARRSS